MSEPLLDMPADAIAERLQALVADTDIPLERQTPWQRYEMASFGDNRPTAVARSVAEKAARSALQQQLSEQIAHSRRQARDEGHAEGHADGYAAGHAEGLAQGRLDALAEREQLLQLAAAFSGELAQANEAVSRDVLALALDVAKAMLKTALPMNPELVLPAIDDAMRRLPSVQAPALLHLHPDDLPLVQAQAGDGLAANGGRMLADAAIERGGCRIETGSNQVDAELSTRWTRIAAALGTKNAWSE